MYIGKPDSMSFIELNSLMKKQGISNFKDLQNEETLTQLLKSLFSSKEGFIKFSLIILT
jgi:hypothetical protein